MELIFSGFHYENLGVPREVGLKFRRIGITGKFRKFLVEWKAPPLSSLAPGGGKMRDPGDEVGIISQGQTSYI